MPALLLGDGEAEALGVPKPALLLGEVEMEDAGLDVKSAVALARKGEGEEIPLIEVTALGVPMPALLLGEGEMEVEALAEMGAVALAREGEGTALGEAEPAPLFEGELLLLPAGESVAEVLTLELAVAQ